MRESDDLHPVQHEAGWTANRQWTEERDRLHAVLEATSDGIALFDYEGRLLLANLVFRKFFGVIPEGLAHEDPAATLVFLKSRVKNPAEFERSFRGLLLHPETTERDTIELKLPYPRVLLRIRTPVRDEARAVIGHVHTLRDVTVEREIAQMKSEFVSTVSHELRTPLTSIKGSLQLIMGNPQELLPFQQELLAICLRNADRLIRLVSDVLDLSRIEAGKLTLKLSDQTVPHLIELALASVSELVKERRAVIDVNLPPDLPPVYADQDGIVQILTNLLSNAIKFSGPAGRVRVVAELRRVALDDEGAARGRRGVVQAIAISVIDQGRGIAQEDLDTLFVPFHRLDRSATRETTGTGLGLAICKGIVEEHGGRIWARSEGLGLGTTVTVLLPMEGPPRRHLLLADDDLLFVSLLTEVFRSAGYLVTAASDGEATLQMIEQAVPDLLILDLLLPRVDGWGVMKILRAKATTRDLPILAVTSLGASDAERTLALGADDYLSKPISASVLIDTVGRLIAGAERRRRDAEAEKAAEQLLKARSTADEEAERVRHRILIVEDNPINLELMMELLEHGGYEIYTCGDGQEVMRQAKAHRPDLILLDINLPHIDGLTLARMLREDPETGLITIVAVSAYSVAGDEERIRQAGCDGFIPKPVDTKAFLQTISTFLDRETAQ
ncbi:MAG: response regulator [candidate division NC10 bacterium]|nr:response regulator [candidate division NC10 bacterium]MDE2321421.1 response regulator [candidate division NC10 bacterium]